MKKTVFMAALLAMTFAVLIGSCASSQTVVQVESMEQAAQKVLEGDYYLKQFERYKEIVSEIQSQAPGATISNVEITVSSSLSAPPPTMSTRNSGSYTPSNSQPPSEQDIDRAIACYEEALRLQPRDSSIQTKLENARRIKQQWLAQKEQ